MIADGPPSWVKATPAQEARARELVADRRAAWVHLLDYPTQATRRLVLHRLGSWSTPEGKLYVDDRGQVFGWAGAYTWVQARQHPVLLVYRDHELRREPHVSGAPMGWSWSHRDYDGPPDNRCGWSATLTEARRDIREREGER